MTVVTPTTVKVGPDSRTLKATWTGFTHTITDSNPLQNVAADARSICVEGTFDSATVTISGSNDGTNYHTLHDLQGNALTFTTAGLKSVEEATLWIKCSHTGGTATEALTVTLIAHGV